MPPVGAGVLVALLPFPPLPPVGAGELVPLLPQNCCFKVGSFAKSTTYVCAHAALLDSAHNALNSWALGGASLFMTELIAGHPAIALLLWFPPLPPDPDPHVLQQITCTSPLHISWFLASAHE